MVIPHPQHKRQLLSQDRDISVRGQACGLVLSQVGNQSDRCSLDGIDLQQPHTPGFDQPPDGGRRTAGYQPFLGQDQFGAVIRDQNGTEGNQLQRQRRLARPRRAGDQKGAVRKGDTAGMKDQTIRPGLFGCPVQTGRPTTKRAPSGSLVTSAAVGRMFSAQITPPCASTICFEIERPRPELLPKWLGGRSE